ncbi:unnamed protein product [Cyclocybe aegerita]|uniref:Lariat debranching enzyme C-terminal domain-containing protein n=1 Tax=Cyclocybe aegerita TaxID=1973307 RepID=A0A8S0WW08_CYCAE|nr:unnamed protein product [Cyclocybe aegerita]
MAVPNKYKQLQHFYKYYTGEKTAPILTLVIGGNHEASNYMWELYHGGWLAPNIYFLGHAGAVRLNGLKIAGSSGIFKPFDFRSGHYERLPYDNSSMRSIYHIREYNVRRLSLLSGADIFLSHDWPQSIEHYGDLQGLLSRKSFLRGDIDKGVLGSPPLMGLLRTLQPEWWFAAHLHTRYEATVVHGESSQNAPAPVSQQNPEEIKIDDDDDVSSSAPAAPTASSAKNPDEITLDDEEETVEAPPQPPPPKKTTKFLALDKCLPKRQFLEAVPLQSPSSGEDYHPPRLSFDPEWLAIARAFHPWLSTLRKQAPFPEESEARAMVARELAWIELNVRRDEHGEIPVFDHQTFVMTAPGPGSEGPEKNRQPRAYTNPQTEAFCRMLDVLNKINPPPPPSANTHIPVASAPPPREEVGA